MTINLRRLRALLAVAEQGSVIAAARELNVTQPAVTKAVQDLEADYGVRLFDRTRAGMLPTPYGAALVRRAKLVFAELGRADAEVQALREGGAGLLVVGALPYARTVLVPRAVSRMLRDHPEVEITIFDGEYERLQEALQAGELDVIVGTVRMPAELSRLQRSEVLFHDDLAAVVRSGHPLAGRPAVDLADLVALTWVLPRQKSPQGRHFEDLLQARNIGWPRRIVYCDSLAATRGILLESDAVTVVSRHRVLYEEQVGLLHVLPISLTETRRPIGYALRYDAEPLPTLQRFLDYLRVAAAEIAPPHLNPRLGSV